MSKLGEAVVEVRPDLRPLNGGLLQAEKQVKGFVAGANASMGKLFAVTGLAAGGGGLAALLADSAMKAADLGESLSKTRTTFGKDARLIEDTADDLARRFGLVKQETIDAATNIGLIGKASGLSTEASARLGAEMAKLAADVSSFYNVPMAEALRSINSGLVGEAEPMRRFGVLLSEGAVQAEAFRIGLVKTEQASKHLTEQQKVMARVSLIQNSPAMRIATGDLDRTIGSAKNQLRKLEGDITNLKAAWGEGLIGPLTEGVQLARELGEALGRGAGKGFNDKGAEPGSLGETVQAWLGGLRALVANPGAVLGRDAATLQKEADARAGVKTGAPGETPAEAAERRARGIGPKSRDDLMRETFAARAAARQRALDRLRAEDEARHAGEAQAGLNFGAEAAGGRGFFHGLGKTEGADAVRAALAGGGAAAALGALPGGLGVGGAAGLLAGTAGLNEANAGGPEKKKLGPGTVLRGAESAHEFIQNAALDDTMEREQLEAQKRAADKAEESAKLLGEILAEAKKKKPAAAAVSGN